MVYLGSPFLRLGSITNVCVQDLQVTGLVVQRRGFRRALCIVVFKDVVRRHGRLVTRSVEPCAGDEGVLGKPVLVGNRPMVVKDLIWDEETGLLAFCILSRGLVQDVLHGRQLMAASTVQMPARKGEHA